MRQTLIRPANVIQPSLPRPKHPSLALLIRLDLRRKPLTIEVFLRVRVPVSSGLQVTGDSETPLANDGGRVAVALVAAGLADVGVVGLFNALIPLEVAVVVVRGVGLVVQVLVGVSGAPELVHHLDVDVVVLGDVGLGLGGTDALGVSLMLLLFFDGLFLDLPSTLAGSSSCASTTPCHYLAPAR